MKPALSIFFVVLYTIAMIRPAYPLVEYYVKLEEYKAKCVNKARPQLHCNGQCILMQKLKAIHGEEQAPIAPAPAKINMEEYPVTFVDEPFVYAGRVTEVNSISISIIGFVTPSCLAEIFHPPS